MLQSVLDQVAVLLPALQGQLAAPRNQQNDLPAELLTHWQAAQPQAGKLYWCARSWGMLMWQPAYLTVFAVYASRTALDLSGFWQDAQVGITQGFTLPEEAAYRGAQHEIIPAAAQFLLDYHQRQYAQLNTIYAYSAKQAACMTVDCVLAALLHAQQHYAWSNSELAAHSEAWLEALQWTRHGNLMFIPLHENEIAALNRQGCCQHFRIPGEEACSTCPRWPMPIRVEKIKSELTITE
ncbi:siderophore ferric iron reductase [Deefgea rivuli]|uniref:siderophore ferric iron reductase n=1 Tax=Deefgea rivuli TaxID=400948 RepID=UPI000481C42F|nr:siderophore ferric iron reductase [Deefgea rivuli]